MIGDFKMTRHAIQRALDMGIDGNEIRECLMRPLSIRKSKVHNGQNYRHGRITCAVMDDGRVVTVVWSDNASWEEDLQLGGYKGRSYRGATPYLS